MVGAVVDDSRIARGVAVAVMGHAVVMLVLVTTVMAVMAVMSAMVVHRRGGVLRIRTHRRGISGRCLVGGGRCGWVGGVVLGKCGTGESEGETSREKHPGIHGEPPC